MPTAKRQKYLDKLAKKQANKRTKEERSVEVNNILKKLGELGFPEEEPNIIKFKEILNDFLETGATFKGILPLVGYGRELCYFLCNNKRHSVDVMLRANDALK